MNRLTDHSLDGYNEPGCNLCSAYCYECCKSINEVKNCEKRLIYNKLAAYEDAEENGVLKRLPCSPGDTVYLIIYEGKYIVFDVVIYEYVKYEHRDLLTLHGWHGKGTFRKGFEIKEEEFGKTVFLTKEEAEKALGTLKDG